MDKPCQSFTECGEGGTNSYFERTTEIKFPRAEEDVLSTIFARHGGHMLLVTSRSFTKAIKATAYTQSIVFFRTRTPLFLQEVAGPSQ